MQFLQGKDAINRIVDGGGVPSRDKTRFTVDELENFYSLNILELWEFMHDLDWCLTSPIGIDVGMVYKKPFNDITEFILRKCYGFERCIIENSDLAGYAVKRHIQRMSKISYSENSESCSSDNSDACSVISQLIDMEHSRFIDAINGDNGFRYIDLFKRLCSENAIVAEHKMESLSEREVVSPQYNLQKYNKELKSELAEALQRIALLESELSKCNSQQYVNIEVEMSPVDNEELDRLAAEKDLSPDECLMKCVETAVPMFKNFPGLMNVAGGIRGDKHRIFELEKQVASLEVFNAELSATRTQAATEARQNKVLGNWQAAFKIMIPVILHCRTDGPKKRTKAELQSMCSKHGGELTSTQLEFLRECLRECLGEDHVNTEGGPTLQS